jgi:hypothetical protein
MMKFLHVSCFALVTLAIASGAAMAAPYQQYKVGACGTSTSCTITFTAVPAGKTAELTNVSCHASYNFGADLKKVQLQQLSASNVAGVSVALMAAPNLIGVGTPAATGVGVVSTPVTLYATGGQKFRVRAELLSGAFKEFSCHISGKI